MFAEALAFSGLIVTILSLMAYVASRFSRLETDVCHIQKEIAELKEVKEVIYKIHAQNDLILSFKSRNIN